MALTNVVVLLLVPKPLTQQKVVQRFGKAVVLWANVFVGGMYVP